MNTPTSATPGQFIDFLKDPNAWWKQVWTTLSGVAEHWCLPVALAAMGIATTCFAARSEVLRCRSAAMNRGARLITVLVPPSVEASAGQAFWAHLHGLLRPAWRRATSGQPHLSFEYAFTHSGLKLSIWVPGTVPPGIVERAIEAAWPGAQAHVAESNTAPVPLTRLVRSEARISVLMPTRITGGRLRLARGDVHPLASKFDTDPLRPLLGAGSGLARTEHASVQVLARPATGLRARRYRRLLRNFRKAPGRTSLKSGAFDIVTPGGVAKPTAVRSDLEHAADVRAALVKSVGPLWEATVLYTAASTGPEATNRAERKSDNGRLRGIAHGVASSFAIHAGRNWWARRRVFRLRRDVEQRRLRGGNLLSLTELAAVAHLPFDDAAPGVMKAGAKATAPPPHIYTGLGDGLKPLGIADAGGDRPVGLTIPDSRHHLHIIGATGSGKSTLMANLVLADIAAGRGAVVIDPKGDLVPDILARLPEQAIEKTILLDPAREDIRPALNVLAAKNEQQTELVVDNLVGIFRKIYTSYWGPRTDDIMRSAALSLLKVQATKRKTGGASKPVTLTDIPLLLLADTAKRASMLEGLSDPVLTGFWDWYGDLSDASRAQAVGPLMNKLRAFLLRDFVKSTVAAPVSGFAMADVLNGGVLLARLPKGLLGEETVRLLGSFIVASIWQAASARVGQAEDRRLDSSLTLDECHNFLTLPYPLEDMLAEARGYRLSLVLAHQNLAQLPADVREGVSANARSKVFFSVSPEDGRDLERHTKPSLLAHDLSHLGGYQAAARLVADGQETAAFTLRTRPLPPAIEGRAEQVLRDTARRHPATAAETAGQVVTMTSTDPRFAKPEQPAATTRQEGLAA
ncbi:type IV secretion system DNA-binding domain-containing protein [Catenulispora pinisilvae]|uniref:type IV secretion system DNA-binding domain-containing protein n=1 Tax=Catenulispora pinisilvae TaxID=2705253 RepID=UPI0018911ED7|nr:type IV secretion system DNA-binding domain-containing protein [Catenulispora pinisilvae]